MSDIQIAAQLAKASGQSVDEVYNGKNLDYTLSSESLSKYKTKNLCYPIDLGSTDSEYGQHRIVFFINAQGASKLQSSKTAPTVEMPPSRFSTASGEEIAKARKNIGESAKILGDSIGTNIGSDSVQRITAPKKRLEAAISLYMPENLQKSYSVGWGEVDGQEFSDQALQLEIANNIIDGIKNNKIIDKSIDSAKALAGNVARKIIGKQEYLQKATSITPGNTKSEQLFRNVDYATVQFDYNFAPKSEQESANVLNIIRMFRHHMLPEYLDTKSYLFIYPSEFEIRYYFGDTENRNLETHMTAVLTNMNINYNPNGQFTTFKNGMPTHINISLTFKELAYPTKETSGVDRPGA